MIAIVDYGMGNVRSVANALDLIGEQAVITSDPSTLADASHIILPGVGAFGDAIRELETRGLVEVLEHEVLTRGKPLLGICLGMQLLGRGSTEHGTHKGLGWLPAEVDRLDVPPGHSLKVPHVGWSRVARRGEHPILLDLRDEDLVFYFAHSYRMQPDGPEIVTATCEYGAEFAASVSLANIVATQFHPEKSQDSGIQVLKNFVRWDP